MDRAVSVIYAARTALEEIQSFQNLENAFGDSGGAPAVSEDSVVSHEEPVDETGMSDNEVGAETALTIESAGAEADLEEKAEAAETTSTEEA